MKLYWVLFWLVAICLLALLANIAAEVADCPQMDNSVTYDESGKMTCKDGRRV